MCLGNTTTYRCCGRKDINYTGSGRCDLGPPYPNMHVVHGWNFTGEICSICEELNSREEEATAHRHARMTRRAKGVLEYFNGFRSHPDIRDDEDWFVPRGIEEPEVIDLDPLPVSIPVSIPLSFLKFVEMNRHTIGIGMFPGKEEKILQEDVDQYIEYLRSDRNFSAELLDQFEILFHNIRASEQENFDFNPRVASVSTFREYHHDHVEVDDANLVGDEAREAAWQVKIDDYGTFLAGFVAPERMSIDWQASRDNLAVNDRRELYGFHRQDHLVVGNGHGWLELQDTSSTVLSFHDWVHQNTTRFNFEEFSEMPSDEVLTADLERYERIHLYPYGSVNQIIKWQDLRTRICNRPLEWTPGSPASTLISFSEFLIRESQALHETRRVQLNLLDEYRSHLIAEASEKTCISFELAWEEHNEKSRDMLYGWNGEGFPPPIPSLRNKRQAAWGLLQEIPKHSWPRLYDMWVIRWKLTAVTAILQQHIALWIDLTEDEETDIDTRINECADLIAGADFISQPEDQVSPHTRVADNASLIDEDILEVPSGMAHYQESVSLPTISEFNPSIEITGLPEWPKDLIMDEDFQVELFARLLDDDDSEDENRPWKRRRRNTPDHWFEEGGPLADVQRPADWENRRQF